ncbi:MAG: DUF1801 domain-containing protein [Bacteroidota bacterium]
MKASTPDGLDALFDQLPEEERIIATILRELILETLPGIREKKSYGAPFYFGNKAICYLWPASITWGGKRQGEGVTLGFQRAKELDHHGFLTFGTRKYVGSHAFFKAEDVPVEKVQDLLRQAGALDKYLAK